MHWTEYLCMIFRHFPTGNPLCRYKSILPENFGNSLFVHSHFLHQWNIRQYLQKYPPMPIVMNIFTSKYCLVSHALHLFILNRNIRLRDYYITNVTTKCLSKTILSFAFSYICLSLNSQAHIIHICTHNFATYLFLTKSLTNLPKHVKPSDANEYPASHWHFGEEPSIMQA